MITEDRRELDRQIGQWMTETPVVPCRIRRQRGATWAMVDVDGQRLGAVFVHPNPSTWLSGWCVSDVERGMLLATFGAKRLAFELAVWIERLGDRVPWSSGTEDAVREALREHGAEAAIRALTMRDIGVWKQPEWLT